MSAGRGASSLARRTLVSIALRIGLVIAIVTVVSFLHVRSSLKEQAVVQLERYVEQRRERESAVFALAEEHLRVFEKRYLDRAQGLSADIGAIGMVGAEIEFAQMFMADADGTVRLRDWVFGAYGITGLIGRFVTLTGELRQRLSTAFDVIAALGPAWHSRFVNLYALMPENAVLMYWPDHPWARRGSDWELYGKLALAAGGNDEVVVVGNVAMPTDDRVRWSDLYFDYGANAWLVSATKVIGRDGRRHLTVGQDVLLQSLIERTLTSALEGTYNILFRDDGRLIAHPRYMEAIQATSGAMTINAAGDAHLSRIFSLATQYAGHQVIVANDADDEILALTRLDGPGWILATVFPERIVANRAFATARIILALGAAALILEIVILSIALRNQVAKPLGALIQATEALAAGQFAHHPETDREDEIGRLARSFTAMAGEIQARETALSERNAALATLNKQLQHELSERHRAEEEIARQREALHQSEKLKALGALLASVAHELNNPLSVVIGRAALLDEQLRNSPHAAALAKLRAAAERCGTIVKTFLALARQQPRRREPVRIAAAIDDALDLVAYRLERSGVEIRRDIPETLPEISADAAQVCQVFSNLFLNAQQAMADQSGPRVLDIRARAAADVIVITVADNGPGIPAELVPRIFEPLFTTKPKGIGTGMGLAVSHGVVAAYGGTLSVEVPDTGGTRFTIILPVQPPGPQA